MLIALSSQQEFDADQVSKGVDRHKFWEVILTHALIKSPRYTGGDFMFLYRFVRRRRRSCRRCRRPQILVHAITFEQLFGFLSFLAWLLALPID